MANGRVDEEGPWLASLVRQRQDDAPDELHVLVEPATPESAEYTTQLVQVITQLYRRDVLSLTGALTRALRAAHEHLLDWNRKSLPEHRVGAGASCIALTGFEAYLAQAGPSLAYLRRAEGTLHRFQAEHTELEQSLGMADDFVPHLRRIELEPGDLLVVASSALDDIISQEHVGRILAGEPDAVLPELYLLCKDTPNLALVLLSAFEEPHDGPPDFLRNDAGIGGKPLAQPSIEPIAEAQRDLVEAGVGDRFEAPSASIASALSTGGTVLPPLPVKQQVDEIKEQQAPLEAPGMKLRGSGTPRYRKSAGGGVSVPQVRIPRLAIFAAIALAVLGIIAYWQLSGSVEESREDRFASLVAGARESNARAQATNDAGLKRQLLGDARAKLDDAAKIHGDDSDVQSLQADVAAALNVLNAVYEVRDAAVIADLSQLVTGDLGATQISLGGDSTYVVDAEGGRVLRVPIAGGAAETIFEEGTAVNLLTAGHPVELAWSPETNSLIIADSEGQAFTYFPDQGTLPLVVRDSEQLGSIDAISTSAGNLYLLDRGENQVWRYLPSQGGFDSERTALLDGVELKEGTDLAVAQDVYVLDANTGVRRFVLKSEADFPLAGIDTPLVSPKSITVLPGSNRVVLVDSGNKRIVVASQDGRFLRQIVSPEFTDLRAVTVDEGAGVMYILNRDTVLRATFPP